MARQVATIAERAAAGARVRTVQVEVGALRQVVPDALSAAWRFVVLGTALDDAELQITATPAVLQCLDCDECSTIGSELGFYCRACDSPQTRVISGEEFRVLSIDVGAPR